MRFQLCYINDDDPKDFLCGDNAKCADKGLLLPIFLVRETLKKYSSPKRKKIAADKKRRQTISGMSQTLLLVHLLFFPIFFSNFASIFLRAGKGERAASGSALQ